MGSIYSNITGFTTKKKTGGTVVERKKARRLMVRAMVKELKAAGKPIDLQAINKEVLNICGRKHQKQRPRNI